MNNFSYNSQPQEQDINDLLNYQNKKLAKQQNVYAIVFTIILILLLIFAYRRVFYTYYDGYVNLEQNNLRAIDDLYILDIYKNVGDVVQPGDTLYSYILLENLLGQFNVNTVPSIILDHANMKLRAALAKQELPVIQTKINEIQKQLKSEQNDIFYGLTDNTKRMALEAELNEYKEKLSELRNKIQIYESMAGNSSRYIVNSGYGHNRLPYSPGSLYYENGVIQYCCAPEEAIVTDIKVAKNTVVFEKENIIDLQHTDYKGSHIGVMAYIPAHQVKYINNQKQVDVIVNDDIILHAHMSLLGLRVEDIPKHLLSNFSHDIDAVIAYFLFDKDQYVPFWVLNNHLPVRVRVRNDVFHEAFYNSFGGIFNGLFSEPDSLKYSPRRIFEIKEDQKFVPVDTTTFRELTKDHNF